MQRSWYFFSKLRDWKIRQKPPISILRAILSVRTNTSHLFENMCDPLPQRHTVIVNHELDDEKQYFLYDEQQTKTGESEKKPLR